MNSYFLQKYAQLRHDEFLAQAQQERLIRMLGQQPPQFGQRMRGRIGDWLIAVGYKLKAQPPHILWEQSCQGKT